MKIVIPNYRAPDSFVDNVAFTLEQMGHEVHTMPVISNHKYQSKWRRGLRLLKAQLPIGQFSPQENWLTKFLSAVSVDLVLCLTQVLHEDILQQIKEHQTLCVAWWGDAPSNLSKMGLFSSSWDHIFLKDQSAVSKFVSLGYPASHLLEAMNPAWHKPIAKQNNQSLVIAGSFYGYRSALTEKLLSKGYQLQLFGQRPSPWAPAAIRKLHSGKFIIKEEKSRKFGEALACLNSTSLREFDSVNCRAFEIAGAGGLQLMEYRPAIESVFIPGEEILCFQNLEDLEEIIFRISKDAQYCLRIRQAGLKRAKAEHTYSHRLNKIFQTLSF